MLGFTFGDSTNITLDSLSDICEAMERAIIDVTVEYEISFDPLPTLDEIQKLGGSAVGTGPQKFTWSAAKPFRELSKSSCDLSVMGGNGGNWDVHISQAYNGKVAKKYQLDGWPRKTSKGIITNKEIFRLRHADTPLFYTVHHFTDHPLSQILREKEKFTVVLDNKIQKVNNDNAICVSIYAHIEGKKVITQRVFFSLEHNFTPVKIEYFNGRTATIEYDVLELKEIEKGIWFPMKGCAVSLEPNDPKIVYQASKVVLNQGLKKEFFDIEFPPGAEVRDEIMGSRYIIKPTLKQFDEWLEKEKFTKRIESIKTDITNETNLKNNLCTIRSYSEPCVEPNKPQAVRDKMKLSTQASRRRGFGYKVLYAVSLLFFIGIIIAVTKKFIPKGKFHENGE